MKLLLLTVIFFVCQSHVQARFKIVRGTGWNTFGNGVHSTGGIGRNTFKNGYSIGGTGQSTFTNVGVYSTGGTGRNTGKISEDVKTQINDITVKVMERMVAGVKTRECLRKLNDGVLKKLEDHTEYVRELADISVAKVRKYYSTASRKGLDGNQRLDLFWRLVYPEMSAVIPEGSDFPVADNTNPKNKETAVKFLRKACEETGTEILDWDKVEQNICSGSGNWKPSTNKNTVHEIFVASLIEYYTQEVLATSQGLQRITSASNVEELKKRWERVSELLTGRKDMLLPNFESILPKLCVDDDLPDDPTQRKVFTKLSAMALNIERLEEPACPILEEKVPEGGDKSEKAYIKLIQMKQNASPYFAMKSSNIEPVYRKNPPTDGPRIDTGAPEENAQNGKPGVPDMAMD